MSTKSQTVFCGRYTAITALSTPRINVLIVPCHANVTKQYILVKNQKDTVKQNNVLTRIVLCDVFKAINQHKPNLIRSNVLV